MRLRKGRRLPPVSGMANNLQPEVFLEDMGLLSYGKPCPFHRSPHRSRFNGENIQHSSYEVCSDINRRRQGTGHLWQGRFFSCVLDEAHLYAGMRYVENNPVRSNIAKTAEEYRWSSARSHVDGTPDPVLSNDCYVLESVGDWSVYLEQKEESRLIDAIRQNTRTGRPCGDDGFVQRLEGLLQRALTPMPRGRPRNSIQ